jgi:hypothetical protein
MRRENVALALSALALVVAAASPAIANSLITGKQIAHHTIHTINLAADAMPRVGKTGKTGELGPMGPVGPPGPQGPAGGLDLGKVITGIGSSGIAPGVDDAQVNAPCVSGGKVLGGGFSVDSGTAFVFDSKPNTTGNGWTVDVFNPSAADGGVGSSVTVSAICESP